MPADTPVITPVPAPTVATALLPLTHEPPVVILPKVIVAPTHTGIEPVIADGNGLIVTIAVTEQPVLSA